MVVFSLVQMLLTKQSLIISAVDLRFNFNGGEQIVFLSQLREYLTLAHKTVTA